MTAALAFVSPNHVIQLFDDLAQLIRNVFGQDVDDILYYFEDSYIGRFLHNAPRRELLFLIEFWNMFNRIDEELSRTNNAVEG